MLAAIALAALPAVAIAQGFGGGNGGGNSSVLVLYTDANYTGTSINATGTLSALGRETHINDKTSSLRVTGAWEVCENANFKGKCVTIAQDIPDLKTIGMNNNISSVRPSTGFGGGNDGEQGSNVTRYDAPRWQGVPLIYCGKSLANCGKPNADAFCQLVGHSESMTHAAGAQTRERGYVAVDRSYQSGGMMFSSISCLGNSSGGGGPGFGGGNGGGQPSTNYSNPAYQGAPIAYCGKGGGNCGEANANAYCKSLGHTGSVSYTEGSQSKFQVYSPAELSFRSGGRTFRAISCAGTASGGGGGPGFGDGNGGGTGGGNSQSFSAPVLNGMRVNSCGKSVGTCGKTSADAFCRIQGFSSSSSHTVLKGLTGPLVSPADSSISLVGQAFDTILCIK